MDQNNASLPPENVQEYPRPAILETTSARLVVMLNEQVVADTTDGLRALETHHAPTYYFPRSAILAKLRPAQGRTFCEWKGVARYFDVELGGCVIPRSAWTYEKPSPSFGPISNYVAFYAGLFSACYVADMLVQPQPGDFYGGWVTTNLRGQIKGAPGTRHW